MEARIFMKFEIYAYEIQIDSQLNFNTDPCKDTCARIVNIHVHISSRVCAFMTRACASLHGSL